MLSLVPDLHAMVPQTGGNPGMMGQFALFGIIFLIFFLLVIRPQQKKAKKHREMIASVQKGDQVVTAAGIYGKISKYFDDREYMLLEIADKTVIKVQKTQIADVIKSKAQKQTAEDEKNKEKEDDRNNP